MTAWRYLELSDEDRRQALAAVRAYVADDQEGYVAIVAHADPARFLPTLVMLCGEFGRVAFGDDVALDDALMSTLKEFAP